MTTEETQDNSGVCLKPHEVLLRPLVTEKGVNRSTRNNQYAFEVSPMASKLDIRNAIIEMFHVRVEKVRTQNRRGKLRRHRFRSGKTKDWKKAVVTLHVDDKIDFF